ncbi:MULTISPECIES: SpoIIE family protein phosphatase [Marichromatium]|uniref:Serine/threonine protein phosphatase PrpC n=1 Tax=Marichromatium gracile TaxID=1048 RepID=A0A4R4AK74_MARGR|nr:MULTISPECIES: SpoIIE family protein phosphatase [Marichromatium]MBO8085488.1 SpoIIE family protein phosphatase [Marichromatium sp.]MBK1710550.1 serine/threonine protein phosphatase [Marichromatium gracile]RNE92237.1 serine/threonine protein phosphatase [Marichromatium sp. AB31]RNE92662.1 serine/threonine protein phosphatase [Marichromatium sp. AB32]TCW39635.1 serine/threonine protein phosphatase PrpC [Marichromatium gracile]
MALNPPPLQPSVGQALRSHPDELHCGDQLGWWTRPDRLRLALADGLGHGHEAEIAASAAIAQVAAMPEHHLEEIFLACDQALRDTRGAALAIVDIHPQLDRLRHAAVGNIRSVIARSGLIRRLSSSRGIVGAGYRDLRAESFTITAGDWLTLFTDGIQESAEVLSGLDDATVSDRLAEQLIERWADGHDDAGILIYRHA